MALSHTAHISPGTTSLSGRGSRMYSSPTGRRGQASLGVWGGEAATTDSHTAHRRPTVSCSMPRKGTTTPWILARPTWCLSSPGTKRVKVEEGMCQVFCIRKSIVLKCKTKHAFRPLKVKKIQSRISRSRAASQVRMNAPFRWCSPMWAVRAQRSATPNHGLTTEPLERSTTRWTRTFEGLRGARMFHLVSLSLQISLTDLPGPPWLVCGCCLFFVLGGFVVGFFLLGKFDLNHMLISVVDRPCLALVRQCRKKIQQNNEIVQQNATATILEKMDWKRTLAIKNTTLQPTKFLGIAFNKTMRSSNGMRLRRHGKKWTGNVPLPSKTQLLKQDKCVCISRGP